MLRRTLDQRIAITLEADGSLCLVDPVQLESALLNIAINSRDAMSQGGTLAFACRDLPQLPLGVTAEPGQEPSDGYVAISVSDSGSGMSESVMERAFEPFFTTKESGRGTGLGLSTVYGFARQSHGAVALNSTPGVGTTVTLYLPRIEDDGDHDIDIAPVAAGTVPPGLRVLLVEDDAEVRNVIEKFLTTMGCEVVPCADGEEALRALAADVGIGLLLTDVALGVGIRGTELADEAFRRRPGLAVLLMSGFSSDLLEELPAWELLRKPYSRAELERAIVRALAAAQ
jgi:CheY-like chemotaxis protein